MKYILMALVFTALHAQGQFTIDPDKAISIFQAPSESFVISSSGELRACDENATKCVALSKDGKVGISDGMTMEQAVAFVLRVAAKTEMRVYKQLDKQKKEMDAAIARAALNACRAPRFEIVGKSIGHS